MADLERDLRAARPAWPEPSPAAEAAARAALGLAPRPRSPRSWAAGGARRRGTLIVVAALMVTGGAAVAATIIGGRSAGAGAPRPASLDFGGVHTFDTAVSAYEGPPSLAVDGHGVVTLVWGRAGRVVASSRAPGGEWSAPERLSDPATRATQPRVAADRAGDVTVTWRQRTAGQRVAEAFTLPSGAPAGRLTEIAGRRWAVVARTRRAGGAWAPEERLSPETSTVRDIERPGLAMTSGGAAVVTWDAGGTMWAVRRPARGVWEEPVEVGSGPGEAVDPELAGTPGGGAIVVWSNREGLGTERHYVIRAAAVDAKGAWQHAAVVADAGPNAPHASAALNVRGDAAVAWISEGLDRTRLLAAFRPAGGPWEEGRRIADEAGLYGRGPGVAVDTAGTATVLAGEGGASATRSADATWRGARLSPARGRVVGASVVPDATGATLVARTTFGPSRAVVDRLGGTAGAVAGGGPGNGLVISAGPDGTTAVAWSRALEPAGLEVNVAEAAP